MMRGIGIIDLHNHLLPGVDDGASDIDESRAALERMQSAGVVSVVVTPHLRGSSTTQPESLAARLAELDRGWSEFEELVADEFEGVTIGRGVELMLDTPEPDLSDPRLRLNGGEYVLVEFPFMTVPPYSSHPISELRMQGWRPVIAHPERYSGLDSELAVIESWRRAGGLLQVNLGSVVGRYGDGPRAHALELLSRGWVDLLASDYHSRGRTMIGAALEYFEGVGARDHAQLLLEVNPSRILAGEETLPVPALPRERSLWSRLKKVFR